MVLNGTTLEFYKRLALEPLSFGEGWLTLLVSGGLFLNVTWRMGVFYFNKKEDESDRKDDERGGNAQTAFPLTHTEYEQPVNHNDHILIIYKITANQRDKTHKAGPW